jgi:hypothetical protein
LRARRESNLVSKEDGKSELNAQENAGEKAVLKAPVNAGEKLVAKFVGKAELKSDGKSALTLASARVLV